MKLLTTPPLNPWTHREAPHYASPQSLNTSWSSLRLLSIPEHIIKLPIMPPLNLWTHHEAPHYASSQSLNTLWSSSLHLSIPNILWILTTPPLNPWTHHEAPHYTSSQSLTYYEATHYASSPSLNTSWSSSLCLLSIPEHIMKLLITPSLNP